MDGKKLRFSLATATKNEYNKQASCQAKSMPHGALYISLKVVMHDIFYGHILIKTHKKQMVRR